MSDKQKRTPSLLVFAPLGNRIPVTKEWLADDIIGEQLSEWFAREIDALFSFKEQAMAGEVECDTCGNETGIPFAWTTPTDLADKLTEQVQVSPSPDDRLVEAIKQHSAAVSESAITMREFTDVLRALAGLELNASAFVTPFSAEDAATDKGYRDHLKTGRG